MLGKSLVCASIVGSCLWLGAGGAFADSAQHSGPNAAFSALTCACKPDPVTSAPHLSAEINRGLQQALSHQ